MFNSNFGHTCRRTHPKVFVSKITGNLKLKKQREDDKEISRGRRRMIKIYIEAEGG